MKTLTPFERGIVKNIRRIHETGPLARASDEEIVAAWWRFWDSEDHPYPERIGDYLEINRGVQENGDKETSYAGGGEGTGPGDNDGDRRGAGD